MDGTVVTVNDGIVTSIIPPHLQAGDFSFADKYKTLNIYKFSEEFCRGSFKELLEYYVQTIDRHSYYEVILGILIYVQKAVIQAEILDGERWAEVDDPNDLRLAEFNFNGPERRRILEESLGGYWSFGEVLDFCFIRNMYFPTPAMMAEIRNTLPQLINNYGSTQQVLNRKLSLALLCEPHRVNVLNGVSQMYPFLGARFGNRKALIPDPSFREYDRTFPNHDCYDDRVGVDTSEIETLAAHADVVVFVNPNNPTGTTISTEWIFRFAQMRPECLVIVDESFIAFAAEPSIVSMLETRALPNVLVLTSLSKSWGVPGVRLGYAYTCDGSLCEDIAAWLPIWNLNSVAEYLLEIVLKHRDSLAASMEATITDREAFMTELKVTPCVETVYPSGGNFLLVTLRPGVESGAEIVDRLLERESVYVKNVSNRLGDGRVHLRVAVRQPHENRFFCAALHRSSAADEFEYRQ
jgi:histidinol-phosphate/aromatic aminotransferase/cobyric acid decarboxylase-like protein